MLASGDLLLAAQRIYPAMGSAGLAVAGVRDANTFDPERALRVQRVTGPCPPSRRCRRSAGWRSWRRRWSRAASCAPLGAIQLGLDWRQHQSQRAAAAGQPDVRQRQGATIPYGGTVDGLSYLYNGATVELGSVGARTASATWNTAWCLRAAVQRGSGRGDRCFRRRHAGRRGIRQRTRRFHGSHVPPAAPVRPAIGPI